MVKATSIKFKLLLLLYGLILAVIMGLLAVVIYYGYNYYENRPPVITQYDELFDERQKIAQEIIILNEDYELKNQVLLSTTDITQRKIILSELIEINDQLINKTESIVEINGKMELLTLTTEAELQLQGIIDSDRTKLDKYKKIKVLIEKEVALNSYYLSELNRDRCLAAIDYNLSNNEISSAISECLKLIDTQISLFAPMKNQLPITDKYINTFKTFWVKNRDLYIAIETRDSPTAKALDQEITAMNDELSDLKRDSDEELNQYIQKIEAEAISTD